MLHQSSIITSFVMDAGIFSRPQFHHTFSQSLQEICSTNLFRFLKENNGSLEFGPNLSSWSIRFGSSAGIPPGKCLRVLTPRRSKFIIHQFPGGCRGARRAVPVRGLRSPCPSTIFPLWRHGNNMLFNTTILAMLIDHQENPCLTFVTPSEYITFPHQSLTPFSPSRWR